MAYQHETEIRVRYQETDGHGHVHHGNYITWFELGRTEMLRASGRGYEELEQSGIRLVVSRISCRYYLPCRFGDVLTLRTTAVSAKGARIVHQYQLFRGDELLADGESTIACVDAQGHVKRLPPWLRE